MILLLLPLLICFVLMCIKYRRIRGFSDSSILPLLFYTFSSVAAFYEFFLTDGVEIKISAMLVLSTAYFLVLFPLLKIDNSDFILATHISSFFLRTVCHVVIWPSLIACLFYGRYVTRVFSKDVGDMRIQLVAGQLHQHGGTLETICAAACSLYLAALVLFFIVSIRLPKAWVLQLLLLVASLSETFRVFYQFGRDGVVFWVLPFFQLWLIFRNQLPTYNRLLIRVMFVTAGSILLISFGYITYSRFAMSSRGTLMSGGLLDLVNSLISYAGQSNLNYSRFYESAESIRLNGHYSFSWILSFIIDSGRVAYHYAMKDFYDFYAHSYGSHAGVFGTFMREWTLDFGPFLSLVLCALVMAFTLFVFACKSEEFVPFKLYFYCFYSLFLFQGIFYFRLKYNHMNLMILMTIFITIVGWVYSNRIRRRR